MVKVIPAIIAQDFEELKAKLEQLEPLVDWVQLDIMDGKFVPNLTWNEPKRLIELKTSLKVEAHLMVENPAKVLESWEKGGAARIIVHWEALGPEPEKKLQEILQKAEVGIGLALNPKTNWQKIEQFLPHLDLVLFLGVEPGFGGQEFLPEVLTKISSLHQKYPDVKIEVDGGINPETGKQCLQAGADILVSGSYIFKSQDASEAIAELRATNN